MHSKAHAICCYHVRIVLMGALLPLFSGVAMAAEPPTDITKVKHLEFNVVDANHDGFIDDKEVSSVPELGKIFKSADKDRDGKLSAPEFLFAASSAPSD